MRYHPERVPSAIDRYQKEILRVFGVLDSVLSKQEWLVGGKLTVADLSFIPYAPVSPTVLHDKRADCVRLLQVEHRGAQFLPPGCGRSRYREAVPRVLQVRCVQRVLAADTMMLIPSPPLRWHQKLVSRPIPAKLIAAQAEVLKAASQAK